MSDIYRSPHTHIGNHRGFQLTLFGPTGYLEQKRIAGAILPLPSTVRHDNPTMSRVARPAALRAPDTIQPPCPSMFRAGLVADALVVAIARGGDAGKRSALLVRLIAERIGSGCGLPVPNPEYPSSSDSADAEAAYEGYSGAVLEPGGFVPHPRLTGSGALPDRLVGTRGLVRLVSPSTAGHFDLLVHGQEWGRETEALWQLACTGRDWCDVASHDPAAPHGFQLVVKRIWRDEARIRALELLVEEFLDEVEIMCAALRSAGYQVPEVEMKRSEFSLPVKRQAIERSGGYCEAIGGVYGLEPGVRCNAPLVRGVEFDHYPVRAADGGDGTLDNCVAACRVCHRHKTRTFDMPMIAKRKRIVDRNAGIRKTGSFLTNRMGPMKRKLNGETVAR